MNWIDLVLIGIILLCAYRGFKTGFIQTLFGLVGLLVGVGAGYLFAESLAGTLDQRFGLVARVSESLDRLNLDALPVALPVPELGGEGMAEMVVYGLVFAFLVLSVSGIVSTVGMLLSKGLKLAGLGLVDHIIGPVIGVLKGAAILVIVLGLVVSFSQVYGVTFINDSLSGSAIAPSLIRLFYAVTPWTPA